MATVNAEELRLKEAGVRRYRPQPFRSALIGIAIVAALTLMTASATAHAPGIVLSAEGAAVIDGQFVNGQLPPEWPQPSPMSFLVNLPPGAGGGIAAASMWAKNDANNLYLAVVVESTQFASSSVAFTFDNDHDGNLFEPGDDDLVVNSDGAFFDKFISDCVGTFCSELDASAGGTSDGEAAAGTNGVISLYELSHPLDDADNAHDFSLRAGDTVGFTLTITLCNQGCVQTFFPGPQLTSLQGDIGIAGKVNGHGHGHGGHGGH